MSDADVVREALLDVVACARSHHGSLKALEALDRLVARLAEAEQDRALEKRDYEECATERDKARERVALLEETLREYADPSAWGRIVTAAGNRETVFLVLHDPPWKIADEALGGVRGGEEQRT